MQFTVFWSHPIIGHGTHIIDCVTAELSATEIADSLAESFVEDEQDLLSLASFKDDLTVDVWPDRHLARPTEPPVYSFE